MISLSKQYRSFFKLYTTSRTIIIAQVILLVLYPYRTYNWIASEQLKPQDPLQTIRYISFSFNLL